MYNPIHTLLNTLVSSSRNRRAPLVNRLVALIICGATMALGLIPQAKAQMNVPALSQRDGRWASHQLGRNVPSSTLGNRGCAVTCIAMERSYFYGSLIDPAYMNDWLLSNGGFYNDLVIFSAVRGFAGSRDYSRTAADLNYINTLLDHGYLVIAMTYFPPSRTTTHFVLITGHSGYTYYINDPWTGYKTTFNSQYGDPGRWIYSINYFH